MLYKTVSFTGVGGRGEGGSKEISLQGFVEESNLKKLFIDGAYYVNLPSHDIQRLPLRPFIVKEGRKRGAFINRVMIKASVIITAHQKEEMVRRRSSL